MYIDWQVLGVIAVIAAAATLAVVLLGAFAIVALSAPPGRQIGAPDGGHAGAGRAVGGIAVAALCLLAAALIIGYGVYLIIA